MKIKDFNDHVRIGTNVRFKGVVCTVQDIDRRIHAMVLRSGNSTSSYKRNGNVCWIRCSEVEFVEQADARTDKYKWVVTV